MSRGLYTAFALGLAALALVISLGLIITQEPTPPPLSTDEFLEAMQEEREILEEQKRILQEQNKLLEQMIQLKLGKLKSA